MRSQPKIWFLDWPSSDLFFQPHGIWVGRDGTLEATWACWAALGSVRRGRLAEGNKDNDDARPYGFSHTRTTICLYLG